MTQAIHVELHAPRLGLDGHGSGRRRCDAVEAQQAPALRDAQAVGVGDAAQQRAHAVRRDRLAHAQRDLPRWKITVRDVDAGRFGERGDHAPDLRVLEVDEDPLRRGPRAGGRRGGNGPLRRGGRYEDARRDQREEAGGAQCA